MAGATVKASAEKEHLLAKFDGLYEMIAAEVQGLRKPRLDFTSNRWRWSEWSIRQQLAHIAAATYWWFFDRWGAKLFPEGPPRRYRTIASISPRERTAALSKGSISQLLTSVRRAIDMEREVIASQSPEALKSLQVTLKTTPEWSATMVQAQPRGGVTRDAQDPAISHMTLEGTLRHCYYEATTHLYNIQRLKRAQGLPATVKIPREGYWVLDSWDRSEP